MNIDDFVLLPVEEVHKQKHILTVLNEVFQNERDLLEQALIQDFKDMGKDKPENIARIILKHSIPPLQVPVNDRQLGSKAMGVLSLLSSLPQVQRLLGNRDWSYTKPRTIRADIHEPHDLEHFFNQLFAREGEFKSTNRYNSILYHIAALIYHDLFHINHTGENEATPFLDLSFLYGNQTEEIGVRSFVDGLLKPDAFADDRFVYRPQGVAVLAVVLSRNHNYVAQELKRLNEGDRFSNLSNQELDEKLFQTAKLINRGCWWSIVMDFINKILNIKGGDFSSIF